MPCGAACERTSVHIILVYACRERVSIKQNGEGEKLNAQAACSAACERTFARAKVQIHLRLRKAGEQYNRKRGEEKKLVQKAVPRAAQRASAPPSV